MSLNRAILPVATITAVLIASSLYLFRVHRLDNPALGLIVEKYKWGKANELLLDADRNGTVDARYRVASSLREAPLGYSLVEGWESSRCNGAMDIHLLFTPRGHLAAVEYDSTMDGTYDQVFHGTRAGEFLKGVRRPLGCGTLVGRGDE
jgi:hypothetical protein